MWNELCSGGGGGGLWARIGEREISIRKGTAESRPEELKRQYPDSGSLTKLCVLNAQTPTHPHHETPRSEEVTEQGEKHVVVHITKHL